MRRLDYPGAEGPFKLIDVTTGEEIMVGTRREVDLYRLRFPHRDLCYMRTTV